MDDGYKAIGGSQVDPHNHFILLQASRCDIDTNLCHVDFSAKVKTKKAAEGLQPKGILY
jgi:hypothetical protein